MLARLARRTIFHGARLARRLTDALAVRLLGREREPFHDVDAVRPELRLLERHFADVRAELDRVLPRREAIPRYHEVSSAEAFSAAGPTSWRVLFLRMRGRARQPNEGLCPRTAALLDRVPGVLVAFFSILEPGKCIPPHRAVLMTHLRYHLALRVPADDPPRLRIAGREYVWREGEGLLWDDALVHSVENRSAECRVVLIVDVLRPLPWPLSWLNALAVGLTRWWTTPEEWERDVAARELRPAPTAAPGGAVGS